MIRVISGFEKCGLSNRRRLENALGATGGCRDERQDHFASIVWRGRAGRRHPRVGGSIDMQIPISSRGPVVGPNGQPTPGLVFTGFRNAELAEIMEPKLNSRGSRMTFQTRGVVHLPAPDVRQVLPHDAQSDRLRGNRHQPAGDNRRRAESAGAAAGSGRVRHGQQPVPEHLF